MSELIVVSISLHTKFKVPSFSHSKHMIWPQNFKMGHVTQTMHLVCHVPLHIAYTYPAQTLTTDCSHFRDMIGAPNI